MAVDARAAAELSRGRFILGVGSNRRLYHGCLLRQKYNGIFNPTVAM
jgi:hypothetical protein